MKLLFLGSVYPKEREDEICRVSRYIDFPSNALQWALLNGFDNYAEVMVVTTPNVKSKKLFFKGSHFKHTDNSDDYCMGFCTRLVSKKIFIGVRVARYVLNKDFVPDVIFIYAISMENLKAAKLIKRRYPKVKIVLMVPDLMEFMRSTNNRLYIFFKNIESRLCNSYIQENVDAFVLLSEYMKERLPINNKPYTIVEGIYYNTDELNNIEKDPHKVILYTGNLNARYGIENLLKAFSLIEKKEYRLWIRGDGDCETLVREYEKGDKRIKYFDKMSRTELLALEKQATLLVNPVRSTEPFTKYFFPSKTMEYMASGTPTLMSPLLCLPESYKRHLYLFTDESIIGMSKMIQTICEKDSADLFSFGQQASDFIFREKNELIQCKKIIDLINDYK